MSSLNIFLAADAFHKRELEIVFYPVPLCYRYTVEEVLMDSRDVANQHFSDVIQTFEASEWINSFRLEEQPDSHKIRHLRIQNENQSIDVMYKRKPQAFWRCDQEYAPSFEPEAC